MVVSTGPRIDYTFLSGAMQDFTGLSWPHKADLLPEGTVTDRFNNDPRNVQDCKRESGEADLRAWFGTLCRVSAMGGVLGRSEYGRTPTIIITDTSLNEQEEDARLEESWTPRYRR